MPTLFQGFSDYDDPGYITENPMVRRGLSGEGVYWAFTTIHFGNWFPLTWLSHMADVSLFGMGAGGHHATSAALHALNASLAFLALRSLTGARWRSAAAAALFAAHPLRVESVAWAAERKDVLCAAFFLGALLAYARYARRPSAWRYSLVLLLGAMALMSKAMAVTLPFVLLLLDAWPLRRFRPPAATAATAGGAGPAPPAGATGAPAGVARLLLEKAPLVLLSAAASAWTVAAQGAAGALRGQQYWPPGQRAANAAVSVARYLGKMAWPANLSVFYPHPAAWPAAAVAGSVLLIAALTAAAWALRRRAPYLLVGWLWFLGMLVPVSGVVQPGLQAMADRFAYLPSIGLTLAVVWAAADLVRRSRALCCAAAVAAVTATLTLAAVSWHQEGYWASTADLFGHALAVDEANWLGHDMVGMVHSANGDEAAAIPHFRRAVELAPEDTLAYFHLARSLQALGRAREAIPLYREALRLSPDLGLAHLWLAIALSQEKAFAEADDEFKRAAALMPADGDAYVQWGLSELDRGDKAAARTLFETALRVNPEHRGAKAALGGGVGAAAESDGTGGAGAGKAAPPASLPAR